jgi:superfamily II DNA or RNA helicase
MEDVSARPRVGPLDDYLETGRRSTRAGTRARSHPFSSEGDTNRRLRPRASAALNQNSHYDDRDELQASDGDLADPTFAVVQSDIVRTKRKRLRKMAKRQPGRSLGGDSDIEFESRRRSSRANKTTRVMADNYVDDDDIYYVEEERTPAAPKVVGVRETFQTASYEFKEAHRLVCESCGYADDKNKGPLIYCQGCAVSYHKACLGIRSAREHRVTKVGPDSFVMQCRFCIGVYKKKDVRAPSHDFCQGCHARNQSCVPFSERKTPKQEEALRNDNDGVDPITKVDPKLINNPDNVLFRCGRCHRAWHYEHLPHPNKSRDPAIDDPLNLRKHRREEYQVTWTCKGCQDTEEEKVDKIVAWRPVHRSAYQEGKWITDFEEDDLEYLLKWENKSYNHCMWMPGAWVYGVTAASMRLSFVKRTFGEGSDEGVDGERQQHTDSLLRWTEKEAIHDVWVTPDIILDVHYAPRTQGDEKKYRAKSREDKFEDDLSRIFSVIKIYVKFEGLGYDDVVWDTPPDPDAGPMYDAFCEAYREYLNGRHFKSEPWRVMRERIEEFRQLDFRTGIEVTEQPKGLQRGKLMEYQVEGLNWMLYNFREERSVILADEMGLGKTVQVVALLSSFIQDNPNVWPFLIVVPNATCANWRREIKKWAPDLRVVAYYGGRVSQSLALQYELFPNGSEMKAHVVIMSYDSAKDNDTRLRFSKTKWAGLVVDEAQALKNDNNTLYKALHALRIDFKLLLTGTPLQNNKRELFNLLQFIEPSMNAERLDEQFAQITSENLPELHNLIRPYFLRRTKAEVLTFLPPMGQIILPVSMSVLQERLCKSIMERNPQLIRSIFVQGKMKVSERGALSNILMQLRKCLCHPFIYSQAVEDRTTSVELTRRNLVEASSKLMLLEIMLPKLKERGHRVLMFSQFLDQLTILEDFLAGMGLRHERLDGTQSSMEKQKKIDAFNAPDSDIFIMLLSTRAGGVGINLATADTVIILDPDWNPHQDIQALSRAHRIGQQKKVLCFQLMTVDSAEEKILQIGRKKLALDHLLIETMDNDDDAPNDVESVLKHGAAALFGEGKKKDAITYDSTAVDKLLDRSAMEETKTDEAKSAESAFAYARIWANDEGALADDLAETEHTINVGVWDEILQKRAEEARRETEQAMEMLGRGGRRRGVGGMLSLLEVHS